MRFASWFSSSLAFVLLWAFVPSSWAESTKRATFDCDGGPLAVTFEQARAIPADSPLRCVDPQVERQMIDEIDRAREAGDTAGGAFEVIVRGLPAGLGSYVQWDRKLDGRLGQALMSIPAIKGVGIGLGPIVAGLPGSRVHDEILPGRGRPATVS